MNESMIAIYNHIYSNQYLEEVMVFGVGDTIKSAINDATARGYLPYYWEFIEIKHQTYHDIQAGKYTQPDGQIRMNPLILFGAAKKHQSNASTVRVSEETSARLNELSTAMGKSRDDIISLLLDMNDTIEYWKLWDIYREVWEILDTETGESLSTKTYNTNNYTNEDLKQWVLEVICADAESNRVTITAPEGVDGIIYTVHMTPRDRRYVVRFIGYPKKESEVKNETE